MKPIEKDFEKLIKKYKITKIQATRPSSCPEGTRPVQIVIGGKKIWVCRKKTP